MSNFNSNPISQLVPGTVVLGTDIYPATDITDTAPTHPTGYTKKYSVSQLQNYIAETLIINAKDTCLVATTGDLNAIYIDGSPQGVGAYLQDNGIFAALVVDGVNVDIGDRVLVAFQSNPEENGIYTLTTQGAIGIPWVLTRASDYTGLSPDKILFGDYIAVISGTLNALTFWFQTSPTPISVNDDPITFQKQSLLAAGAWVNQTTATVTMAINTGYTSNAGISTIAYTLPTSSPAGAYVEITGLDSGLFTIEQGAGQQIRFGTSATTVGPGGEIASQDQYANIRLTCIVADTLWTVSSFVGTFTIL